MRLLVDTLIASMLVMLLGGILWQQRQEDHWIEEITSVQQSVQAIRSQALYRAALGNLELSPVGYPRRLDPLWFTPRPGNPLVGHAKAPWLEQVGPAAAAQLDPAYLIADARHAAFWYNPQRGIVRARVPRQVTEQATVDLYNTVNGTALRIDDVIWHDLHPGVAPIPVAKPAEPADPVVRAFTAFKKRKN
jgi:hypothetical protein